MVLPVKVCDAKGEEFWGPYLLYLGGWTEDRYFAEAPEMWYVEFADGELIVHSPVAIRHQDTTAFLFFLLKGYVDAMGIGKVFMGPAVVQLRAGLDYEPDIFFITNEQVSQLKEQHFSGAPALVVEVLSESTRNYDLRVKALNYQRYGVPEYWAVDMTRRLLFRHLLSQDSGGSYVVTEFSAGRLESQAAPGFWIDVSWLWAEPLPGAFECLRALLNL